MKILSVLLVLVLVALFVALILLVVRGVKIFRQRTMENLQKLAGRLGLEFKPKVGPMNSPGLAGTLRGRPAEIFSYAVSTGKSSITWIAISIHSTGAGTLTFSLQRRTFGSKILELFGAHELIVGDPVFDAAWFVRTNQPDFFRAALIPELREKLMAAQRSGARGAFELKGGLLKYAQQGTFAEKALVERFVALADLMGDLAAVAEVAGS